MVREGSDQCCQRTLAASGVTRGARARMRVMDLPEDFSGRARRGGGQCRKKSWRMNNLRGCFVVAARRSRSLYKFADVCRETALFPRERAQKEYKNHGIAGWRI